MNLFLISGVLAQNNGRTNGADLVFRDRVVPHWFADPAGEQQVLVRLTWPTTKASSFW